MFSFQKKRTIKTKGLERKTKLFIKIEEIFKKNIQREEISFYLDGVGCQHKYNQFDEAKSLKSMTWQQRSEDLDPLYTAKGSHTGVMGEWHILLW